MYVVLFFFGPIDCFAGLSSELAQNLFLLYIATVCLSPYFPQTSLQVSDLTNGTTLQEGGDKEPDFILEDRLPDRGDFGGGDFLEDGFGFGDGGMGEFGGVPNVSDIALEEVQKQQEGEGDLVVGLIIHAPVCMCIAMFPGLLTPAFVAAVLTRQC